MHNLPKVYFKWTTAALHVLVMPMFFLAFSIVYQPFNMTELLDMGRDLYTLNISILFAIIFVLMSGMRSGLRFFVKDKHFTWAHYICWCIGECLLISLFASLYLSLISDGLYTFFNVLFKHVLLKSYLILIYPYLVLTLAFAVGAHRQAAKERDSADESLIRFYDIYKKPKLLIAVGSILYIKADENYVNIVYMDGGRISKYSLRASMNSIEENCTRHGLIRCQRSYFVNPKHIAVLRKEGGSVFADLDADGAPSIPVSKRYYDKLSGLL